MGKYRSLLEEREKNLKEGKYPEFNLKAEDPIKWEVLYTRLSGLVQNSRETAKRITASPVVRETGEFIFGLLTPEGDSVFYSSGLLLHTASLGTTVKWMLMNDYEEDPGIRHRDFFFNNDAYLGGSHPNDQSIITPIFYQDKLVGWAGGLSHVAETGSPEAGGNLPSAQTRFSEGLVLPCVKIAENDRIRRDLDIMVDRDTRVSVWWLLDNRAKIAGCKMIREGVLALIKEYGTDYYLKAIYEYIEDTRQACHKKAAQVLFPGRYRAVVYLDVPYASDKARVRRPIDYLNRHACEMVVSPEGLITLDYDGSSPAGLHPYNATPIAARGFIGCVAIQHLFYDIKYNQGINQAISEGDRCFLPPGSVMNPPDRTYATGIFRAGASAASLLIAVSAMAYYVMGYREEMMGYSGMAARASGGGPADPFGRPWAAHMTEHVCTGVSPSSAHDGLDCAAVFFQPEGDMGDVEVWEKTMPLVWMGRYPLPDSGGFGRYRGGNGLASLYLITADGTELACTIPADRVFWCPGFMGGYPAASNYRYIFTDTNLKELIDQQKPLPHREGDPTDPSWTRLAKGNHQRLPGNTFMTPLKKYDLWLQWTGGGSGFGDPIEREPAAVKKDLELELTSHHTAEKVYGVVIAPQTLDLDYEGTKRLREQIRQARKTRGIPAKEYIKKERDRIMKGELPLIAKTSFNQCMKVSEKFQQEFRDFWNLPEEFSQIK